MCRSGTIRSKVSNPFSECEERIRERNWIDLAGSILKTQWQTKWASRSSESELRRTHKHWIWNWSKMTLRPKLLRMREQRKEAPLTVVTLTSFSFSTTSPSPTLNTLPLSGDLFSVRSCNAKPFLLIAESEGSFQASGALGWGCAESYTMKDIGPDYTCLCTEREIS